MKKFLVPGFLMLFAAGLGQQEAKAGSFSIGISIGDSHRHSPPPVVVARPPVIVARPPVVMVQPRRDDCDRGYDRGYAYVRECEHRPGYAYGHYKHGWRDRYRYEHRHNGRDCR